MKAFLGFIQAGLGIGGLIALFNGQWLALFLCWGGGFLVGLLGSRATRAIEGVSEGGREASRNIGDAIEQLRQGRYDSANGLVMAAVSQFRIGGDKGLLVVALTLQSVTMAAVGKSSAAHKAAIEAKQRLTNLPSAMALETEELRMILSVVDSEISSGSEPDRIVRKFLELTDAT